MPQVANTGRSILLAGAGGLDLTIEEKDLKGPNLAKTQHVVARFDSIRPMAA